MEEKRRNRRHELESKIIVKRLDGTEASEVTINIQDVSKTGVGFECDQVLTIGAVYETFLTIWTKEILHAFVEIVRIEKTAQTFTYGGIFIGMPEMDKARIEVYETIEDSKLE